MFDVVSALCGAALLAIVLYTSMQLADHIGEIQKELLTIAEERVKVTSEALQGIRVMKFYAWEESLATRVEKIRAAEIKHYRKFHYLQIANTILLFLTPVFLGGLVMGIYVGMNGTVSVTDAYTIINVVNITRLAVNMFPLAVASLSQASVTYRRMDLYLGCDEVKSSITNDAIANDSLAVGTISVRNAHFRWSEKVTESSDVMTVNLVDPEDEQAHLAKLQEFSLEGVNLEIDAGSLVMIVGTVGSGKSSLLNALLGEMILVNGTVNVCGGLSYVSQESWIRNASVKNNILFGEKFDASKYAAVLEATQLALDLHALPDGDQTEIGERGINLSGGQKARVAIARAVYHSNYDILILDDPLSAVDPHVAHAIFSQCVTGLAKEKTRLLVLNSHYDFLKYADKIIVVQDGKIAGDGNFADITAQFPELRDIGGTVDKLEKDVIDEHKVDKNATLVVAPVECDHAVPDQTKVEGPSTGLMSSEDRVKGR
ncbi:Multidrug resistance-associated protein ABC Superfamily, partial [Phytophthora palmivora]